MRRILLCLLVLAGTDQSLPASAAILAQTGFNGTAGINPSNYTAGVSIYGEGRTSDEPGWVTSWFQVNSTAPAFCAVDCDASEGDQSLQMYNPGTTSASVARSFAPQSGVVYVDLMMKVVGKITTNDSGDSFNLYTGPDVKNPGGQGKDAGAATTLSLRPNGHLAVSDWANTSSHYSWVATGYAWTQGRWFRVTQAIDTVSDTYSVWVNGRAIRTSEPLNFRCPDVTFIDDIRLYMTGQGSTSIYLDELRVLSHNPLTANASTGFDAAAGYVAGRSVHGLGSGDPFWTGNWQVTSGSALVHNLAGNQVLKAQAASVLNTFVLREYEDQNTQFRLDFDVMIDGDLTGGTAATLLAGPNSLAPLGLRTDSGAALMLRLADDGRIMVGDGTGTINWTEEFTGFFWKANEWLHVTANIDVETQAYTVAINGQTYLAPDPLNFLSTTMFVDDIALSLPSQGSGHQTAVYLDNIVLNGNWIPPSPPPHTNPEPSTFVIAGSGLAGLWWGRRRWGKPANTDRHP